MTKIYRLPFSPGAFLRFTAIGAVVGSAVTAGVGSLLSMKVAQVDWSSPWVSFITFAILSAITQAALYGLLTEKEDLVPITAGVLAIPLCLLGIVFVIPALGTLAVGSTEERSEILRSIALIGVGIGIPTIVSWLTEMLLSRRGLEREVEATRTQIRALEAQIRPHFLHNTLNTISALVPEQPAKAQETIRDLGDLLRHTMEANREERIPLTQEVEAVRRYLAIEEARFGSRLQYRLPDAPDLEGIEVPGLILQPLVENAVRHGIAKRIEGGVVDVTLERSKTLMTIRVRNPLEKGAPSIREFFVKDHALYITRERLRLMYGDDAQIQAGLYGSSSVEVSLRIPFKQ